MVFAPGVVGGGCAGDSDGRVADEDEDEVDWARIVIVNAPAIAISRNNRMFSLATECRFVIVKSPSAIGRVRGSGLEHEFALTGKVRPALFRLEPGTVSATLRGGVPDYQL